MPAFRRLCVFCGSRDGDDPVFAHAAIALGKLLASRQIGLVYGGAKVGLMGALANSVIISGGEAIGVIPEKLKAREIAHEGLTELFVVESMHARKTLMAHMADGFIVLPGGWGTLEETFEAITWNMLHIQSKPVGLLNVDGYYDGLLAFVEHATQRGFIAPHTRECLVSGADPERLLADLEAVELPAVPVSGLRP